MSATCPREEYSWPLGVGEWRLRPRWMPFLLLFLPALLCLKLGLWQLDRAEQKRELAHSLAERTAMAPLEIGDSPLDADAVRHRHVSVRGTFDAADQIYIEGRHHGGQVGFHVIAPLRIAGSERRVLVNRGWVQAPPAGVPAGEVRVHGVADVPLPPAIALHAGDDAARDWGERWPYLTVALFQARVDYPLQPVVVLQDPADPEGFARAWPRPVSKEGMHLAYAAQWFAFSLAGLGFFLRMWVTRRAATPEAGA